MFRNHGGTPRVAAFSMSRRPIEGDEREIVYVRDPDLFRDHAGAGPTLAECNGGGVVSRRDERTADGIR